MSKWHGGKGSVRRNTAVKEETIADNWIAIFGNPKKEIKDDRGRVGPTEVNYKIDETLGLLDK